MISLLSSIPSPPNAELVLGPLRFRYYGLAIALAVIAGVSIARRRWSARGGDPEDITSIALVAVPAGLIGARLYHVVTDFSDKYSDGRWWPDAFMIWKGGLGIPGAIALGALGAILACRKMRLDWRHVADAAAPAIPVGQAIGRLGNWFNQELYGRPTDLPWAIAIDEPAGYPAGSTFHPTFLYEGLWNLALAALIVVGGRRFVLRPGRWLAVYVVGYGVGRLWVESLRIDFATEVFGFRVNTWISLVAIALGLLWLFWGGNPIDGRATAELRAGGDPQGHVGVRAGGPGTVEGVSDAAIHHAAEEMEPVVDDGSPRTAASSTPEVQATPVDAGPVGASRPDAAAHADAAPDDDAPDATAPGVFGPDDAQR